eukprot:8482824-Lingulodinium_polyedra.AAC.1
MPGKTPARPGNDPANARQRSSATHAHLHVCAWHIHARNMATALNGATHATLRPNHPAKSSALPSSSQRAARANRTSRD